MNTTQTNTRITHFIINPHNLEKWIHQNAGEIDEIVEGCLLDNLLIACKRGYAALYEKYVNTNESTYEGYFQPYKDGYNVADEFYTKFDKED